MLRKLFQASETPPLRLTASHPDWPLARLDEAGPVEGVLPLPALELLRPGCTRAVSANDRQTLAMHLRASREYVADAAGPWPCRLAK
jgi:hypothetical protein